MRACKVPCDTLYFENLFTISPWLIPTVRVVTCAARALQEDRLGPMDPSVDFLLQVSDKPEIGSRE